MVFSLALCLSSERTQRSINFDQCTCSHWTITWAHHCAFLMHNQSSMYHTPLLEINPSSLHNLGINHYYINSGSATSSVCWAIFYRHLPVVRHWGTWLSRRDCHCTLLLLPFLKKSPTPWFLAHIQHRRVTTGIFFNDIYSFDFFLIILPSWD